MKPAKFDAVLKASAFSLGVETDERHILNVAILPVGTAAQPPLPDTLAYLACVQLSAYLEHGDYQFDLPIRLTGSLHQLHVWEAMRRIPAGETRTYGDIATEIGSNARAVGSACGANPVPIVVPCHRIVAANGLGGFMGGTGEKTLSIKRWLLQHEGWPGLREQPALF
jgi:methylated-DNA-[protein]-cysteine S-methyltransferase